MNKNKKQQGEREENKRERERERERKEYLATNTTPFKTLDLMITMATKDLQDLQ